MGRCATKYAKFKGKWQHYRQSSYLKDPSSGYEVATLFGLNSRTVARVPALRLGENRHAVEEIRFEISLSSDGAISLGKIAPQPA